MFVITNYPDIRDPVWECQFRQASMWYQECKSKSRHTTVPKSELCCRGNNIVLRLIEQPLELLKTLLYDKHSLQVIITKITLEHTMQCFPSLL